MMNEINGNPLLRSNITKICGNLKEDEHTSVEKFGAMVYSKYGLYLALVSAFCTLTIFNHLDWEGFEKIAQERQQKGFIG